MRRTVIIISLMIALGLVACQEESANPPTLISSPTLEQSATPAEPTATLVRQELPPTWTPLPAGAQAQSGDSAQASNTPRPTNTLRPDESPLPPTWTPIPTRNPIQGGSTNRDLNQTATFLAITPSPTITETPINDACYLFTPDEVANRLTEVIIAGQAVTIFWTPIPLQGYSYEVRLFFQDGSQLVTATAPESANSFTFEEGLLIAQNGVYGWEVQPLFNLTPDCFPITGEIFVQAPLDQ